MAHIQNQVDMRSNEELTSLQTAYQTILESRARCVGSECSFFDSADGVCVASDTDVAPDVDSCTQTEGPLRLRRA